MQGLLHRNTQARIRLRDADTFAAQRAHGLESWRALREQATGLAAGASREDVLGYERLQDISDREQAALEAMLVKDQTRGDGPVAGIAHRHDWVATACYAGLLGRRWDAVDAHGDATTAVAALVALQPDVLVCSDRLLGGEALEVVRRAPALFPATRLVVQIDQEDRLPEVCEAGAHVVLSHRLPIADLVHVVDELLVS